MDAQGRVLIAERPAGKHLAGRWEFPGGKLEHGEERRTGLARELREELGIVISAAPRPLIRLEHTYPDKHVHLDIFVVRRYQGEPQGREGQALRWVSQDELESVELLPADGPIVPALRLPERLRGLTVGELRGVPCEGMADAMAASDAGADFLVMLHELPHGEVSAICELVPVPVYVQGMGLEAAWELGATGVVEV
jgi:8-oxo-dGTP diphosphatase